METPYELLIKYCRKQSSQEENLEVEKWLLEDDNLSLFLDLKKEWNYIDDSSVISPDKQLTWHKIQTKTYLSNKNTGNKTRLLVSIAVAALLSAIITLSAAIFINTPKQTNHTEQYATISTRANEKSKIQLADGTEVWLNSNSQLTFGNNYNINKREVTTNGELFFNVNPSAKKFILNAGKIKVEVLGTAFNIKTTDDDENIEISLKRGRIAVLNADNNKQLFIMDSLQHAIINKRDLSHTIQSENVSECDVWKEKDLPMYNEPLTKVFDKLEKWYDIKISYVGLDPTKHYTFHIQNESLPDFLELFSAITPIDYKITGKKLYIEAKKRKGW